MNLKYIFEQLATAHLRGRTTKFPLYVNLRDHAGQTNVAEALGRHATRVPFDANQLMAAWRFRNVVLLLDGFDELVPIGSMGQGRRMRDVRFRALQLVREFVRESAGHIPVVISGRSSFLVLAPKR
jgi:hypothetical protein